MFLENVFSGKNDVGRWIAMLLIVIVGTQVIGIIPLGILMFLKVNDNPDLTPAPQNLMDLSAYDIPPVTGLALMIIPFAVGLFTLLLLMKPIHERTALSVVTGKSSFRWKRFFWGMGIWSVLMAVYTALSIGTGLQEIEFQYQPESFIPLILVSILLLPLQTGFEEIFFRGYLMQGFARIFKSRWAPLAMTSILFGGLHYFNPEVQAFGLAVMLPQYIGFGLLFGLCAIMDDGLEIAWGAHTINNILLSVFFTQQSSVIQTPALFNITEFNPVIDLFGFVIISMVFLYLAKKQFIWSEWRYLFSKIAAPAKPDDETEYPGEFGLYDEYEEENDEYKMN